MPALQVKEGPLAGSRLEVKSTVVIGRGDADVVVDDPAISRRHALLRAAGDQIEIEDLDSLNGTWVNGARIESAALLRPGDVVRLGSTMLQVEPPDTLAIPTGEELPAVELAAAPMALHAPLPDAASGRCPECNAELSSSARFCSYCGVVLKASSSRRVGPLEARPARGEPAASRAALSETPQEEAEVEEDEQRPVTALFADIVGSTSLGERLAPHEVKALIGECVNRMSRAVEQFGGSVQAYMGDGIAAFFGVPVAHEDDPDRAALAALRILEVVTEYSRDIAAAWDVDDFDVRIGINSGQVVVGLVGAADRRMVALGDATNVAARLQSAAEPGSIAVGEPTARRLAHRFVLESLGEIHVKGREKTVSAWRLVRALVGDRTQAPTPLVGRDADVSRLRAVVEELVEGRGQLLMVVGEPGIGKTRILTELATFVGDSALWLEGNARSFGGELLYWPFAEILRRWLGVEAGDAGIAIRTRLRSRLSSLPDLDTDEITARLGALLGLQIGPEGGPDVRPEALADEIRLAYVRWIEALCARRPVALAIDDLHWVDGPTRELAEALIEVTDRAPLLIAVAFRPQPPSEASRLRLHALEHYRHRVAEAALNPLDSGAANELIAMLMPDGVDPAASAEVVARAEGNPLYLEELLRALIEEGGLERRRRTWSLTRTPARQVPAALEGLLLARIDQLPEAERRLAQVAAVIGRAFPAEVLARVSASRNLDREISTLLRAQVITELRRYPELVYSFKHGLLQESALSTLTPTRRGELYGAVASVFEERYSGARDDYLDVLASYYARSDNQSKALEYLERAGARAASLSAIDQAAALLERAVKVARELGDAAAEERISVALGRFAVGPG